MKAPCTKYPESGPSDWLYSKLQLTWIRKISEKLRCLKLTIAQKLLCILVYKFFDKSFSFLLNSFKHLENSNEGIDDNMLILITCAIIWITRSPHGNSSIISHRNILTQMTQWQVECRSTVLKISFMYTWHNRGQI